MSRGKRRRHQVKGWRRLPAEVLTHIFSHLDRDRDRVSAGLVCRSWYRNMFQGSGDVWRVKTVRLGGDARRYELATRFLHKYGCQVRWLRLELVCDEARDDAFCHFTLALYRLAPHLSRLSVSLTYAQVVSALSPRLTKDLTDLLTYLTSPPRSLTRVDLAASPRYSVADFPSYRTLVFAASAHRLYHLCLVGSTNYLYQLYRQAGTLASSLTTALRAATNLRVLALDIFYLESDSLRTLVAASVCPRLRTLWIDARGYPGWFWSYDVPVALWEALFSSRPALRLGVSMNHEHESTARELLPLFSLSSLPLTWLYLLLPHSGAAITSIMDAVARHHSCKLLELVLQDELRCPSTIDGRPQCPASVRAVVAAPNLTSLSLYVAMTLPCAVKLLHTALNRLNSDIRHFSLFLAAPFRLFELSMISDMVEMALDHPDLEDGELRVTTVQTPTTGKLFTLHKKRIDSGLTFSCRLDEAPNKPLKGIINEII